MDLEKIIRKIPPFKGLYRKIDTLDEQNKRLISSINELEKKYNYIFSVEQNYERNMSTHYENLKTEVRENKKAMDVRHEQINLKIDGNHNAIVEKERADIKRLEGADRQLAKDIDYFFYKGLHPDQYRENLEAWYRKMTGEQLNLEHPVTFNEKIQWLKLYDSTEKKTRLADKYLVRDYVSEKIGNEYLIPLVGIYDCFDDIDFETMPERFVMKTNHASSWNVIVDDLHPLDMEDARRKFNLWLNRNYAFYSGLELHYKDILPKIVVEQYIENGNSELFDYRFFCFSGKAYSVWVDVDSGKPTHRRNIYDLDWNLLPVQVNYPNDANLERKPKHLKKMIELVEKLSEGLSFVRVDLYEVDDRIYFGEMTFTPQSGQAKWNPPEYNKIYGDLIVLPDDN